MIGITEGYDPAYDKSWKTWAVKNPTILITKDFPKVHKELLGVFPSNIIFHVTCTGLSGTIFEPNTPPVNEILKSISNLNDFQKKHIVLRIDPICPPLFTIQRQEFDGDKYLANVYKILKFGADNNLRMRISFLDLYNHVLNRLEKYPVIKDCLKEAYENSLHLPLDVRTKCLNNFEEFTKRKLEVCGEPGLACTGCVSKTDLDVLGIDLQKVVGQGAQRPSCACLALKKELIPIKKMCPHKCLYCYWR